MATVKVSVTLKGSLDVSLEERENNYPVDELLLYIDEGLTRDEGDISDKEWILAMIQYDLDNDASMVLDEINWDFDKTDVAVLEEVSNG